MTGCQWGYQVRPNMVSCSWTKLLLDKDSDATAHDDPKLRNALDQGILRLPDRSLLRKTAEDVCSDFLRELNRYMRAEISRRIGQNVLDVTPMDCWITVPAVWSEKAQDATKAAARKAGFGSGPNDSVHIIKGPQAGAIATLKKEVSEANVNSPAKGEDILICDCGGGTVDIITYTVAETSPHLTFDEVCEGDGGKCGSTYIDRNLHALMCERFGSAFESIELRRRGPGSHFMTSWERVKHSFGMEGSHWPEELGPLKLGAVPASTWYEPEYGSILLTYEDVEALFKPVVREITTLISKQNDLIKAKGRMLDRVLLIGGFGDSQYLHQKLKAWCAEHSGPGNPIQVLCHKDPQAAIVRGAALRGLEKVTPQIGKQKCRKHYGVSVALPFREYKDPEWRACWDDWDPTKWCRGRMAWFVHKGDVLQSKDRRIQEIVMLWEKGESYVGENILYSCSHEKAPEYDDDTSLKKLGNIRVDFTGADKSEFDRKRKHKFWGTKIWNLEYQVKAIFGGSTNALEFKSFGEWASDRHGFIRV